MRGLVALVIVCVGMFVGVVSAWQDGISMQIGMAALGLLVSMPVAATVLASGRQSSRSLHFQGCRTADDPMSADSIAENFARDRGYPPHMKPPDALPDKHQFDPDKLG